MPSSDIYVNEELKKVSASQYDVEKLVRALHITNNQIQSITVQMESIVKEVKNMLKLHIAQAHNGSDEFQIMELKCDKKFNNVNNRYDEICNKLKVLESRFDKQDETVDKIGGLVNTIEKWRWKIIGSIAVITFMVGISAGVVIQWISKWTS